MRKKAAIAAEFTTEPATPPASIICPMCDRQMTYERTVLNGVNPRERWDWYACPGCRRTFEYRLRTKKLRHFDH